MIKVAFFDIDGTLLPIKKEEMPLLVSAHLISYRTTV